MVHQAAAARLTTVAVQVYQVLDLQAVQVAAVLTVLAVAVVAHQ
jgi:hypothetical protein